MEEVPEEWKKSNVISIFNKGKKEDPRNYKLASLTSIPVNTLIKYRLGK